MLLRTEREPKQENKNPICIIDVFAAHALFTKILAENLMPRTGSQTTTRTGGTVLPGLPSQQQQLPTNNKTLRTTITTTISTTTTRPLFINNKDVVLIGCSFFSALVDISRSWPTPVHHPSAFRYVRSPAHSKTEKDVNPELQQVSQKGLQGTPKKRCKIQAKRVLASNDF